MEKDWGKDPLRPYLEPTQVTLGEKPKACRVNAGEGIRQISPVPSEEGVPAVLVSRLGLQVAVTRRPRLFNKRVEASDEGKQNQDFK